MKKLIMGIICLLVASTAGTALAVKPDNPGGKVDLEAALQAETDARIAADTDLQNQIDENRLDIVDNAAQIQANTDAINALPLGGGVTVLSNGNPLGAYLSGGPWYDEVNDRIRYAAMLLLSETNFMFFVDMDTTAVEKKILQLPIWFSGPSCTGESFVAADGSYGPQYSNQGILYATYDYSPIEIYYVPRGSTVSDVDLRSFLGSDNCNSYSGTRTVLPVLPNNPEVTGIPSSRNLGIITFEWQ